MVIAQDTLNAKYGTKVGTTEIIEDGGDPVAYGTPGSKWTGELLIEGYPDLVTIRLPKQEITKVTIKNCPQLNEITVNDNRDAADARLLGELNINDINPGKQNVLKKLNCGGNKIIEIDFTFCKELMEFICTNNPALDRIKKIDNLEKIDLINMRQSGNVRIMHEVKHEYVTTVVNEVKDALAIPRTDNLPVTNGKLDTSKLKDQMQAAYNPQAAAARDQARKESKEAKDKLGGVEAERDQLKKQLEAINKELGLGNDATEKQTLDKIKELMGRPTSSEYDTAKNERDSLKTEVENKKQKITELENNNNNNNNNAITKSVLVDKTNTS